MTNRYRKNDLNWHDEFVLSREERALGRHTELIRDVRRGQLIPVVRGAYRHAAAVTDDRDRGGDDGALAKIRAIHLLSAEAPIFVGLSAAVVWGLPIIGNQPERVQVASPAAPGGRSNVHVSRTIVGHPVASVEVRGLRTTNLARTVIDTGRTAPFETAVAITDAALRGQDRRTDERPRRPVSPAALWSELGRLGSAPGVARCRSVLMFADGKSASPGESLSRVTIRRLGLPAPVLQQNFVDRKGTMTVDFWWPQSRVIGEFDGKGKYLREEFSGGKTMAEILLDEKDREDRLRALDCMVVRWGWGEASSRSLLRAKFGSRLE